MVSGACNCRSGFRRAAAAVLLLHIVVCFSIVVVVVVVVVVLVFVFFVLAGLPRSHLPIRDKQRVAPYVSGLTIHVLPDHADASAA